MNEIRKYVRGKANSNIQQWVDEDEQEEAPEDDAAMNMGGMGGMPGK